MKHLPSRSSRLLLSLWVLAALPGCIPYDAFLPPVVAGGGFASGGGSTAGESEGEGVDALGDDGGGGGGGPTTGGCLGLGTPANTVHQDGFDQLNLYRQVNGVGTLQYSVTLEAAADAHAKDMYLRSFFGHINPDGEAPGDRAVRAGFCHEYGGENVAYGMNVMSTVEETIAALKDSPGHDENMLRPGFVTVGIGYFHIRIGLDNYYYWVQLFAFE